MFDKTSILALFLLLLIAAAAEPLRSWYPYQRTLTVKQRRESSFSPISPNSGLELIACPAECRCYAKTVRCTGANLREMPRNLPSDTERIIITDASISRLSKSSFQRLPALTQIVLSHNNISEIEDGTFEETKDLQYLDLRHNNLRCLHESTFRGMSNLRVLKLERNKISWMSGRTFKDLPALQWLSLNGNLLNCDCHLASVMRLFAETHRKDVFASSGIVCAPSATEGSVSDASEILGLLYCPPGTLSPIPSECQASQTAPLLSSCQSVCTCDASGFVSCANQNLETLPTDLPENMISLNFANNQLKRLPKNAFSKYTGLRKVNLEGNKIGEISTHAFAGLRRLSSLYLTDNRIRGFQPHTFNGLSALTILYLQKNNISCVGADFFKGLTNLRILHLSDNEIKTIHEEALINLKHLRYLYLSNNQLNCDCSVHWLPEFLKRNEAGGSQMTTCSSPADLKGQFVRDLTLQPCPPGEQKHTCRGESDLQHQSLPQQDFDVAQDCPKGCICMQLPNRVQRSTDDVITFTALRPSVMEILEPSLQVTCTNLGLTSIPFGIPENTKELYLDHNQIEEVNPEELSHLKKLEVLSLSNNRITCVGNATFKALTKLKVLQLHFNKIRCLAGLAFDIKSLNLVSFDGNPLHCGPQLAWLSQWMKKNEDLVMPSPSPATCASPDRLKGSPIISLDPIDYSTNYSEDNSTDPYQRPKCCSTKGVTVGYRCPDACVCKGNRVDCSGKALKEIPKDLPADTRDLFLEHNDIRVIDPERLQHLQQLETLLLSHNKILELESVAFKGLSNLKSLVLSSNGLRCIHPDAFQGLKQLKVLILQNNDISTLGNGTFRDLSQMNNLALGQNPLHCDCNLRWLQALFRSKCLDNGVAMCASPDSLKFKSLFHSNPTNFTCLKEPASSAAYKCSSCEPNPCENGGECRSLSGVRFKCLCDGPFHGERCERKIDACFSQPCKNGGVCQVLDHHDHYQCECPVGYTGSNCEESVDDCRGVVCENGGVCIDGVNNYTCHCAPGYRGLHCEEMFQYCVDVNPCKSDGVCVLQNPSGYKCLCPEGWGGVDCSENLDDCEFNKCENGATCVDGVAGYTCKCKPGFSGEYCEQGWSPRVAPARRAVSVGCAYNRCENGAVCQPDASPLGYRCACPMGFGGTFCEKVFSLSITSIDDYATVDPPNRGCFSPKGNLSLTFSTQQEEGLILLFSESSDKPIKAHRFLIAELHHGHVKISFSVEQGEVAVAYSMSRVSDGNVHRLDIIVVNDRVEMYINEGRNALIQSISKDSQKPKSQTLVTAAPFYIFGAPKRHIKSANQVGAITSSSGTVACLKSFYINGKQMDFVANLFNSKGIKVGCSESSSEAKNVVPASLLKSVFPQSKVEPNARHDTAPAKETASTSEDCRNPGWGCLNGGVCVSANAMSGQQWTTATTQYACRCPSEYEGVHCEKPAFCKRQSRFSYIFDPDTGCVSTKRVVIRSCSGSCQDPESTALMWQQDKDQRRRRRRRNKAKLRVRRNKAQWPQRNPQSLGRVARNLPETSETCCQPIRFRQKSIQFHCPQNNGSAGRVYSRWFRFVRKCGCRSTCRGGNVEGAFPGVSNDDTSV